MNIEDQFISLEIAKKLKEFGVIQDSIFCFQEIQNEKPSVWPRNFNLNEFCKSSKDERIATFTTSELLNMLPNRITLEESEPFNSFRFFLNKSFTAENLDDPERLSISDVYIANYECDSTECAGEQAWLRRFLFGQNFSDKNPANCLGRLLIRIIEKGYIKK